MGLLLSHRRKKYTGCNETTNPKGNEMFKPSVGMAILLTKDNCPKVAVVNSGLVPEIEPLPAMQFFVFPYDYNAHAEILWADEFWLKYEFANTPDENYFVDINEK